MMGRIVFWILVIGLVDASLFFLLHEPPTQPMTRAIPAQAVWVSSHQRLIERMPDLITHPLFKIWIGDTTHPAPALMKSTLTRFLGPSTMIAFVPRSPDIEEPCWLLVNRIDRLETLCRWGLLLRAPPGWMRADTFEGRPLWVLRRPLRDSGERVSLAVGDGLLILCISRDPLGVRHALAACDGLIPHAPTQRESTDGPIKDCARFQIPRLPGGSIAASTGVCYVIPGPDSLSASCRLSPALPMSSITASNGLTHPAIMNLIRRNPSIVLMLPLSSLTRTLGALYVLSGWVPTLVQSLFAFHSTQGDSPLLCATFSGDYAGGFGRPPFRLTTPTLICAVKVASMDRAKTWIRRILDLINARHRMGLIIDPTPLASGTAPVYTIECTVSNFMAAAEPNDRPACALVDDWLLISSHAGALVKLLTPPAGNPPDAMLDPGPRAFPHDATPTPSDLLAIADRSEHGSGFVWIDLNAGGRLIQTVLSLWRMQLGYAEGEAESQAQTLKRCRLWLDDLRHCGQAALWWVSQPDQTLIHLHLAPGQEPDTALRPPEQAVGR